MLRVTARDVKPDSLVDLPGAMVEVSHVEDDTLSGESFVRELQPEPDKVSAESATGQVGAHPKPVEDRVVPFFKVKRPDEAIIFVADDEAPLRISDWLAVVVVEVIGRVVSPGRYLCE
jgi:hypothetical protein